MLRLSLQGLAQPKLAVPSDLSERGLGPRFRLLSLLQ